MNDADVHRCYPFSTSDASTILKSMPTQHEQVRGPMLSRVNLKETAIRTPGRRIAFNGIGKPIGYDGLPKMPWRGSVWNFVAASTKIRYYENEQSSSPVPTYSKQNGMDAAFIVEAAIDGTA